MQFQCFPSCLKFFKRRSSQIASCYLFTQSTLFQHVSSLVTHHQELICGLSVYRESITLICDMNYNNIKFMFMLCNIVSWVAQSI
jgi:hypothetical protein